MEEDAAYYCDQCHKVMKSGKKELTPDCCGRPMEFVLLHECMKDPAWAEHARFVDDDEPCDPGMGP